MRTNALVSLLLLIKLSLSGRMKVDFAIDFFKAKNVVVTSCVCWSLDEKRQFLLRMNKEVLFTKNRTPHPTSSFHYYLYDMENCEMSWTLLEMTNITNGFGVLSKHLVLVAEHDYQRLYRNLVNYTIFPSSDVVIAKRISEDIFELSQVYRTHSEGYLIWEPYGNWSRNDGLQQFILPPSVSRRRNLKGAAFKISYIFESNDTKMYIHTFRYQTVDTMAKQNYGAIKCLMELCNISYTIVVSKSYGYLNKTTNTFGGIIGNLANKETLLSASSMLFTKERLRVVDFIKLMNPQEILFILKKPSVSYVSNIFAIALHKYVWISLFLLLLLVATSVFGILNIEKKLDSRQVNTSVSDCALVAIEAVCQQGTMTETRSLSGRILFFLTFLSFMMIYVSYSANIVVLLQSTRGIYSIQELLQSRMEAGAMNTSYMRFYMTTSTDPNLQQFYDQKIGPKGYYDMETGLTKMRTGFFAFHMETTPAYQYMQKVFSEDEICSVQKLLGYVPVNLGYMSMQKHSPYRKILKTGLLKISEHGLHQRHFNRFLAKPMCFGVAPSFKSVGLIDARQAFIIYAYTVSLAILIFLLELLKHHFKW